MEGGAAAFRISLRPLDSSLSLIDQFSRPTFDPASKSFFFSKRVNGRLALHFSIISERVNSGRPGIARGYSIFRKWFFHPLRAGSGKAGTL